MTRAKALEVIARAKTELDAIADALEKMPEDGAIDEAIGNAIGSVGTSLNMAAEIEPGVKS